MQSSYYGSMQVAITSKSQLKELIISIPIKAHQILIFLLLGTEYSLNFQ